MPPWIEIAELQKRIDEFQLGPIDLTVEPGTITALVGNNGSGKSTLLKLIMGMAKPDKGKIKVFGQQATGENEEWKKRVAFVPQTVIGWNAYTGSTLKKLIASLYEKWDEGLFERLVKQFELPLDKRFGKMSQGMQQKMCLALALPRNADLLILDEPTSFLDISSKNYFMDALVEWMETEERAVIMTSHHAEDIKKLADYLFFLSEGQPIGLYEKEMLSTSYRRYWLTDALPAAPVPGEAVRNQKQIVSNQPDETETYFNQQGLQVIDDAALELEEIINLLLTKKKG